MSRFIVNIISNTQLLEIYRMIYMERNNTDKSQKRRKAAVVRSQNRSLNDKINVH